MNSFQRSRIGRVLSLWLAGAIVGCGPASQKPAKVAIDTNADESADEPGEKKIQPPLPPEAAPSPSPRIVDEASDRRFSQPIASWFAGHRGARTYLQLDKPLYRPGETVWYSSTTLADHSFEGKDNLTEMTFQLISPRGASVMERTVPVASGHAHADFELPSDLVGGEYLLRAAGSDGSTAERPFIISAYEAPRIKKQLEFLRKAYGKGDTVQAAVEIKRPTGEVLSNHPIESVVQLDGEEIARLSLKTDVRGGALVRFELPSRIENGDGMLTVLVKDGGVTESISKRIPIVLDKVRLSLFPEGGKMVFGLPSRVYFEALNPLGKPADIEGRVVDEHGNRVADIKSYHQGMGRFELRPTPGHRYAVEITKPAGIRERFDLPPAETAGCTLRAFDDFDSQLTSIRVAVSCTKPQQVTVTAMLRENLLDHATVAVPKEGPAAVYLRATDTALARAQGIVRLTVFDENRMPLAERLVYRNRRNTLQVTIRPDKSTYTPRQHASLSIKTEDAFGTPVSADLSLSVVDDTVVSYADDKTGHILSRLYLESEIPDKIEEPKVYFDLTEEKAARGLDLLLGTKGWRTFAWRALFAPPPPAPPVATGLPLPPMMQAAPEAPLPEKAENAGPKIRPHKQARVPKRKAAPPRAAPKQERPMKRAEMKEDREDAPMEAPADMRMAAEQDEILMAEPILAARIDADDEKRIFDGQPVRVFPVPDYSKPYDGPRTDFRDTIFWAPSVKTDEKGHGSVSFYLSDAVTSFRVFAEGVGAGAAGRNEKVFKSTLPFSMNIKVPTEVSSGDRMRLPLTLTNETAEPLRVDLSANFGALMKLDGRTKRAVSLAPGGRQSLLFDVTVTGKQGESAVSVTAAAGGLSDAFHRTVSVAPRGFPITQSISGQVALEAEHIVDLRNAVNGTIAATLKPTPAPRPR